MRDEDLLRKVTADGKVKIGGQEFSIKPASLPEKFPGVSEIRPDAWTTEYQGTFSNPRADDYSDKMRVHAPDFLIEANPTAKIDLQPSPRAIYSAARELDREERPEVKLREGIRAALRAGLSQEKIKEIFELELVSHVMES